MIPIIVVAIVLGLGVVAVLLMKKRGMENVQLVCIGLFFLSLIAAYLFKLNNEVLTVPAPIPFYKIAALTEYGYMSILRDMLSYAAPFIALGFFIKPAFKSFGLLASFAAGLISAVLLNLPRIIAGNAFIADEYVYAMIGSGAGYSIYCIIAVLLEKTKLIEKLKLPVPSKKVRLPAYLAFAAVYFFIALVMVFDYGETYAGIQFFDNDVELPKQMVYEFEPLSEHSKVNIYAPSTQSVTDRARAVAVELGINGDLVETKGVYTITNGTKTLTYTESGSWTYEDKTEPVNTASTQEASVNTVLEFFKTHRVLTVSVDKVTDIIEKTDSNGTASFDIYLSTAIGTAPIISSNMIMASVRGGDTITYIRKYDEDLIAESQTAIISQAEAISKIKSGDCAYTLFSEAESVTVTSCELAYMANSSQGYYLPIWCFNAVAKNGVELTPFEIYVEAKR